MLQIEEWFRRPQRKTEKKAAPVARSGSALHRSEENRSQAEKKAARVSEELAAEMAAELTPASKPVELKPTELIPEPKKEAPVAEQMPAEQKEEHVAVEPVEEPLEEVTVSETVEEVVEPEITEKEEKEPESESLKKVVLMPTEPEQDFSNDSNVPEDDVQTALSDEQEDMFEPEDATVWKRREVQKQPPVSLQDSVAESEELEHISEEIGKDVSGMIDTEKEDFLLRQIDEFREKAKQLQQLMQSRENKAKELQGVVDQRQAKASELDSLIHVRRGEADKIMDNVTARIDAMSAGVRNEMSGLSDTVSKEVSGLSQNLAHELNQSTEKTRQVVEAATQNMIDQNTRSLEGLKEQLEQLGHLEQIGELSTEMNSQITTLKTDIADKIHAEDVKCYRNIQASMDEQSKLLSEGDEKTRQHIQEQVDSLSVQMRSQSRLLKVSLVFSILDFISVIGILVFLILF